MKKKYVTLNNTWMELLFSASGFGPNLLMVLMGAYFTDAVNPAALKVGDLQAIGTACYIMPLLFPILWALAKIFDGLIDIPLAALTDGLKTKWGRRRPPILVCFIPMCLSYIMCWNPIFGEAESARLANTIWIVCWALVFFATYTMSLIAYYGSLSTVCSTDNQRLRVSSFKSFFDTISYCLVYALVPLVLEGLNMHIDKFAMLLVPLMITMLIPVFMIKEGERFEKKALEEGYDITPLAEEEKVGIVESIKLTFTNKPFIKWCIVNCCSFFGLQMFLVAMNAMILGGMGMNGTQMAILNTCAFAPVPLMLYMFNKLKQRKGIRFAYQTCLLSFAFCILTFDIASVYVMGNDNLTLQIIIGCLGGVIGSWAIGSFFMMPYMIPAQISSVEEKLTGKNHSAMYFAAQAFTTSIVSAIASSLVYENIKMLFISKSAKGIVRALNVTEAALKFNVQEADVFNLGVLLVPIIVCVFCIIGFVFTFKMPKNFSAEEVSKEIGLEKEYEENKHLFKQEKLTIYPKESILVNVGLWILSGSIFGLIWRYLILSSVNKFNEIKNKNLHFILSILVLPYYGVLSYKVNKRIVKEFKSKGVNCVDLSVLYLIIGLFGLGVVSSIIMQYHLNKLLKYIDE
jgi:Na+/melibiose symporter-like transporter